MTQDSHQSTPPATAPPAPGAPAAPSPGLPEDLRNAYNDVVFKAQMRNLALLNCHFSVEPAYFAETSRDKSSVKHSFFDNTQDEKYDPEQGVGRVQVNWQLKAVAGQDTLLLLSASFMVVYTNLADCKQDGVNLFLRRVGRFACFPYFRGLASQMSWLSQANLPVLPILREGREGHRRGTERSFPE